MTKAKINMSFPSTTKVGFGVFPTAGSTDEIMRLLHKLILWPPAQISCCQLLITKLSATIYVSALYKPPIVSIDGITQPM